uniref:CCHC-type domain-containing protein n=1 Tax=Cannabis sativa TaxID=3483 RepID=A0A803P122_CANSA
MIMYNQNRKVANNYKRLGPRNISNAILGTTNIPNCFELGFARAEDRAWASDNGPWCVRGYSFILKAWGPKKSLSGSFDSTRIWMQIHNLPRDYFSVENGKLLGGKAGKVIKVELDEGAPALWSKFLKILIELNVNLPLFSGCFFELESGGHSWIQFKYERLGIFCYNCGILGHQRRGCPLSSPVTVANDVGIPYPLFGPWLSVASSYLDVFAGANSFSPSQVSSSQIGRGANRRLSLPSAMSGGRRSLYRPTMVGRGSKQMVKVTEFNVGEDDGQKVTLNFPSYNLNHIDQPLMLTNESAQVDGLIREDIGLAFSSSGPTNVSKKDPKRLGVSTGPCKLQEKVIGGVGLLNFYNDQEEGTDGAINVGQDANGPLCRAINSSKCNSIIGNLEHGPAITTNSNESSICGQEVNFHHDEKLALTNFFQAQGTLLEELKKFGNFDLYEIKSIGGDIGVPTASEVNERTTPFKKRKFDEASTSLCSRPWKLLRPHPWAIRDFPLDSEGRANDTKVTEDEPSEEVSLSNNDFTGPDEWKTKGKNVISSRPMEGTFVVEESGSFGSARSHTPVEETTTPPQEP